MSLTSSLLWYTVARDKTMHDAAYKGMLSKEWYQESINTINGKLREVDDEIAGRADVD